MKKEKWKKDREDGRKRKESDLGEREVTGQRKKWGEKHKIQDTFQFFSSLGKGKQSLCRKL